MLIHRSTPLGLRAANLNGRRFLHTYVLYDGGCSLCSREISFLKKRTETRQAPVSYVNVDDDSLPQLPAVAQQAIAKHFDLNCDEDRRQLLLFMHAVQDDGKVLRGVDVFRSLYRHAGLGFISGFLSLPGVNRLSEKAYDWFAYNRHWLVPRKSCTLCKK
jgi:predicted DCC family thiol-disulfide oxidoreductase YuxK